VRVLVGRIKGGPNFLSWIEAKTRKLGGYCVYIYRAQHEFVQIDPNDLALSPYCYVALQSDSFGHNFHLETFQSSVCVERGFQVRMLEWR
jgi:hypothetical protein